MQHTIAPISPALVWYVPLPLPSCSATAVDCSILGLRLVCCAINIGVLCSASMPVPPRPRALVLRIAFITEAFARLAAHHHSHVS